VPLFSFSNPDTGARCDIQLGCGITVIVTVGNRAILEDLLEELLQLPESQIVDSVGGLIGNINVLENIALPVIYHGLAPVLAIERQATEVFADCGVDAGQAEALFRKRPGELAPFDKRLAGFVRGLMMRPEILVYNRFFEGLTQKEMARAATLNAVFRARHPQGTAVYLMQSGMPELQPECHRRFEM